MNEIELCYEYFQCSKEYCPNRKAKRVDCWNLKNTLMGSFPCGLSDILEEVEKEDYCEHCIYYLKMKSLFVDL